MELKVIHTQEVSIVLNLADQYAKYLNAFELHMLELCCYKLDLSFKEKKREVMRVNREINEASWRVSHKRSETLPHYAVPYTSI